LRVNDHDRLSGVQARRPQGVMQVGWGQWHVDLVVDRGGWL
jgi:hypothetical protein